jgi:hypothetical protein
LSNFKREVVMNTEFLYKGPLRMMGFRYSGPPWIFLVVVGLLILVFLGVMS